MRPANSLIRPLFAVMLVLTIFSCSGGGCSGCERCGLYPIPGGFPLDQRIPNAAQVRVSANGLQFVESNIGEVATRLLDGGLTFEIPRSEGSASGFDYTICSDSNCAARVSITSLDLTSTPPSRLVAQLRVAIESTDLAGTSRPIPVHIEYPIAGDSDCDLILDTARGDRPYVGVVANIDFLVETRPAREGYTRIVVSNAMLSPGEELENDDIRFDDCSVDWILNEFRGTFVGSLQNQVTEVLNDALNSALCTERGELGCPLGTYDRGDTAPGATCYYDPAPTDPDQCVPMLLGTDGRGDVGGTVFGSIAPGTHAPLQFVLASGGDGEAVNEGISLFMSGGFMSMDRAFTTSPGHNPCVPLVEPPPLPTVERAFPFRGNNIPGTTMPMDIGFGLSEDYLDYAGYGMFDSGLLCIAAGTRVSQRLSTGLVGSVAPSLSNLTFPVTDAPLTISMRPQRPPEFTIGTDLGADLLTVELNEVDVDFFVWSTERYVRFLTFHGDLEIHVNLTVEGGEIVPHFDQVLVHRPSVSNSEMITDDPDAVAGAIATVLAMLLETLAGNIDPIGLPDLSGIDLVVPEGGVRAVADSGEAFLGIFANFQLAPPSAIVAAADTTLEVSDLQLDLASMALETWGQGEGSSVWLHFGGANGPAGAAYEYSYRIDETTWSRWTTEPRVQIRPDALLLQTRHLIEARARVRGQALSADPTPARAELIVDLRPPRVDLERDASGYRATAADLVTPASALRYRFRVARDHAGAVGEWTAWSTSPHFVPDTLLLDGGELGVEVIDEAGNVGTATMAIIRGVPNPAATGGCGCAIPGSPRSPTGPLALFGLALVLGALGRRRIARRGRTALRGRIAVRGRAIAGGAALLVALGLITGCECGGGQVPCNDECVAALPPATAGRLCCEPTNECAAYDLDALCRTMPGYTCPPANLEIDAMCTVTCSMCVAKPALSPGLLATDLDFQIATDEVLVSGYSPGDPSGAALYGDLVFGTVSSELSEEITWEIVDGVPSGAPIENDPRGWRGGVAQPGDDVGRWTSIASTPGGEIYIAYYDATNGALKLAVGAPGAWTTHQVDDVGDSGRYASLVLLDGGVPAIAYLRIESPAEGAVRPRSSVRLAVASSAMPDGESDWTITEVAGSEMPCRPRFCEGVGARCLETGECVVPSGTCEPGCDDDQACVAGACTAALLDPWVEELPPAYGLYTQLARTAGGLALVWYDRGRGDLWGASATGTTFGAPFLIDGYMRGDPTSGDSGLGASLFVDAAGNWHVTYVDGTEEALRYAVVTGGAVTIRETIDDGATDGTAMRWADGKHLVGDDSSVVVTETGEVRVAYQDATAQHTMLARRAVGGTGWTREILDMEGHGGFWIEQEVADATSWVATWWRLEMRSGSTNGVRILPVP
jgi:hypothetical protein